MCLIIMLMIQMQRMSHYWIEFVISRGKVTKTKENKVINLIHESMAMRISAVTIWLTAFCLMKNVDGWWWWMMLEKLTGFRFNLGHCFSEIIKLIQYHFLASDNEYSSGPLDESDEEYLPGREKQKKSTNRKGGNMAHYKKKIKVDNEGMHWNREL